MRLILPVAAILLLGFSYSSADLEKPRESPLEQVRGLAARSTIEKFKPNERALVVLSGRLSTTAFGLYVFDSHGNCVARDDATDAKNPVDLAVEFVPSTAGPYSVEVHNLGLEATNYWLMIR
jgi:hypothetical protein